MRMQTNIAKVFVERFSPGEDIVKALGALFEQEGVRFGIVSIIGAFRQAKIGAFDFEKKRYEPFLIEETTEILHCTGNISLLDGRPFAHLHATLAGHDGHAKGGHVFEGTIVEVAECVVMVFDGEPPERVEDETTGLKLWAL